MRPIEFIGPGVGIVKGVNQPEYLPMICRQTDDGLVITCWYLTFMERLKILLTGRVYFHQMTFNKPLQPIHAGTSAEPLPVITTDPKKY